MSWTQVHSLAKAAAHASLEREIRQARGLEVTAKPSTWSKIYKRGRLRLFVGAPNGVFWKNSAFYVVDASLDTEVLSNRHIVSYRAYVEKEGMLILDVTSEVTRNLHSATDVRVFRVDARPLDLLKVRCETLDALDRGPMVERLWSPQPLTLRSWNPPYLPSNRSLNDGQQLALAAMTTPGGFFVWGPPGTGKTTVITSAVKAAIDRGQSVLITSHTNVAVDNVLESLAKDDEQYSLGILAPGRVIRQAGDDSTRVLEAVREHPFLRVDRAAAVITNLEANLRDLDKQLAANQAHPDRKNELRLHDEILARDVDIDTIRWLQAAESRWSELVAAETRLRNAEAQVAGLTTMLSESLAEIDERTQRANERAQAEISAATAHDALAQWRAEYLRRRTRLLVTLETAQIAKSALDVANLKLATVAASILPWLGHRRKLDQAQAALTFSQALQTQAEAARLVDEAEAAIRGWASEHERRSQDVQRHPGGGHDLDEAKAQAQNLHARLQGFENERLALQQQTASLRDAIGDITDIESRLRRARDSGEWALTAEYDELLIRVVALEEERANIDLRRAHLKDRYKKTQVALLSEAPVVAATLTALTTSEQLRKRRFDVVIIDESASAEASLLLIAAAKADTTLAIVGDFLQNAPIAEADDSYDEISEEIRRWQTLDIFALAGITDRTTAEEHPQCVAISIQYRYPPIIARTVNDFCYDGLLQSHKSDTASPDPSPAIVFVDTSEFTDGSLQRRGTSWECPRNREIALDIGCHVEDGTIGYVTPYRPQADAMAQTFASAGLNIPTGTSHEFQGREFDTVIFDLLQDDRPRWVGAADLDGPERAIGAAKLLNVALTRAKERLYIIGNWRFVSEHDSPGMRALAELNGDPRFELRLRGNSSTTYRHW